MNDCPFCNLIATGGYSARSDEFFAVHFEPLNPVTEGHRLVVPLAHVMDALDNPYTTGNVMAYAAQVAAEMGLAPCNFITSVGAAATQSVYHLHIHIIPRHEDDGLALPWTGQQATGTGGAP